MQCTNGRRFQTKSAFPAMTDAMHGLVFSVEMITPEIAEAYKQRNLGNRRLREGAVRRYVQVLRRGLWKLTHQGIAFDRDGILRDGQNRLEAVIRSGIPALMVVCRGLDPKASLGMDQGAIRDKADLAGTLGLGLDVTKRHAAAASAMMGGMNRLSAVYSPDGTSKEEEVNFLAKHVEAIDFAIKNLTNKNVGAILHAVTARAWYSVPRARLLEWAEVINTGQVRDPRRDNTAVKWREIYRDANKNGVPNRVSVYARCETALRAFLDGRSISQIREATHELFPIPGDE